MTYSTFVTPYFSDGKIRKSLVNLDFKLARKSKVLLRYEQYCIRLNS